MHAFQSTLQKPIDAECGGFCAPYTITAQDRSFMAYLENYRGPIVGAELGVDGAGTLRSQDQAAIRSAAVEWLVRANSSQLASEYFLDLMVIEKHPALQRIGGGAPERIRTSDLCLRRAALYPAELRAPRIEGPHVRDPGNRRKTKIKRLASPEAQQKTAPQRGQMS